MDDRGLRDLDHWKDKIEVRLDNRQVFFLFFGSALIACLLFILGVVVGKRLESRGRAVAPEIEDPLALLDRVASAATPEAAAAGGGLSRKLLAAVPTDLGARSNTAVAPLAPAVLAKDKLKPAATAKPAAAPAPSPSATVSFAEPPKSKNRFTLQIGAFPDRAAAETFAKRFTTAGVYVVAFEKEGQGTWYRVRAGDYSSNREAESSKSAFERQFRVIAYVVPPAKPITTTAAASP